MTNPPEPASGFDRLEKLLDSWVLHLRGARRAPGTIDVYERNVNLWLDWCDDTNTPPVLDRSTISSYLAFLIGEGYRPYTVALRRQTLRQFSKWLTDEGETESDALAGLPNVTTDTPVVPELTDLELTRLIQACRGNAFEDKRDEAIVRLMIDTGMRIGEVRALTLEDVDLRQGLVMVRRGKGGKGRMVAIGPRTATAIDRYVRARRSHKQARLPDLWLGSNGRRLLYDSLWRNLRKRARAAGLEDFHPHVLRHTFAGRWLARGGSEGGLMATAGWARRDMVDRYSAHTKAKRAVDESRELGLGEL